MRRNFFVAWLWRNRIGQGSSENSVWLCLTCPSFPSSPPSGFAEDLKKKTNPPTQTSNCLWVTWNPDYGNVNHVLQHTYSRSVCSEILLVACASASKGNFKKLVVVGCVKAIPAWLKWMGLGAKQHWCVFYGQINRWGLFQRTRQPKLGIAAKQSSRERWVKNPERGLMDVLNLGQGNGGIPKLFLCLKILFSVVHIVPDFRLNIPTHCFLGRV